MYNWDEKGFLTGMARTLKRIMTKKMYDSGRIKAAKQDGSREFISLLASICADGTALPPALIYKGASGDLQDTWMEDLKISDQAFFASSINGWSSNAFGLAYLIQVFDPATRMKAGRGRRLLIVDGHSSHVNMEFIKTCDRLKICLLILPPHSTHRLQPLDVGCFLPLSTCYSTELDKVMEKSGGLVAFTKRMFWSAFKPAFDNSFSGKNILSAWKKTGIWPLVPSVVLSVLTTRPITPSDSSDSDVDSIVTPYTAKRMRQFTKTFAKVPTKEAFRKLIKANESNAAKAAIAAHRADGLKEALQWEKKKRCRGKKLNLTGEEAGKAQFFSTAEVMCAQSREDAKVAQAEQAKLDKEKAKEEKAVAKAVNKALVEQEAIRKAEQKEIDTQVKAEAKKQAVLDRVAARKATTVVKKAAKTAKPSRIVILSVGSSILKSLGSHEQVEVENPASKAMRVVQTTKSGRQIILPQRLKE